MKIYFNRKPVTGPWGGGTKILAACVASFKHAGHEVVFSVTPDVDVIFCFDPRQGADSDQLGYEKLLQFARETQTRGKKRLHLVQRVGDIGTHGKPDLTQLVMASTMYSDTVVFPSVWAHDSIQHSLSLCDARPTNQWHVIPNAPLAIFQKAKHVKDKLPLSMSFVTHHWSTNVSKGFAFYDQFKKWCNDNGHKFTYIGRVPISSQLTSLGALSEHELAIELPKHDVYVTASLAEAGANHVLEAMACGLPVIYHQEGGSIVEYCVQMGISFDGTIESFPDALENLKLVHPKLKRNLKKYRMTVEDVADKYVGLVEGLKYV